MARTRKISADEILDATERVVLRLGAAGLSIDAVAKEAGVSKSRVVYDHKSKNALITALLERHFARHETQLAQALEETAASPNPHLFARIALAERAPDDLERAVFMAVSAAMAHDSSLRDLVCDCTREEMAASAACDRPQAALMANLALSGFFWTEFSGFHQWTEDERKKILDGIRAIFDTFPEPRPEAPADSPSESKQKG